MAKMRICVGTKMAIRVLDDLRTTRRSETIMLTAIPTSTFQIIEKTKVNSMSVKSTHDRILKLMMRALNKLSNS